MVNHYNDNPTLAELFRAYLDMQHRPARQKDYDQLEQRIQRKLIRTADSASIRKALAQDKSRQLPVQIKSPAYERIVAIEGRTVKLLREYAQEMYEFGPEWQHYADQLWAEARQLDH